MSACFALLLALTGAVDFGADWSAFRAGGDSSRVDFFYAIPYDQLLYTQTDSGLVAQFSVGLDLKGLDNSFHQSGTVFKQARIKSFQEAMSARRSFADGFSVTTPPGKYLFKIAVAETSSAGRTEGAREDTIVLRGFTGGLGLSSLEVGSTALNDSATGAISVLPNPTRRFPDTGLEALYVYYEGYNFSPDSNTYLVKAAIIRNRGGKPDTVVRTQPLTKPKHGANVAYALGVSVAGVEPGAYTFGLQLTDVATRQSVTGSEGFVLGSPAAEPTAASFSPDSLSPLEQQYYDSLQYLATPLQVAYYKRLSDDGKRAYLAKFWSVRDLSELTRRIVTADGRYQRPKMAGHSTDRGRVYVKYGEPDKVDQKVMEAETRPREYWHYDGTGYYFIFIDLRDDGNYRLAWTNAKGEPKTGYESYLTADEIDQYNTDESK
ncbi:MAG TPA: GWxTD domain-containing protein [bacterium]|nr:GWxTD domain-containing protein [bacterium]